MPPLPIPPINALSAIATFAVRHVGLRVPDFEASLDWFVKKLDFRVVREWRHGDLRLAYVAPPADDAFLIEILGDGSPTSRPVYDDLATSLFEAGYHHVCFDVPNVDEILAELRRRDVTIVEEPFEQTAISRRLAFFADPWGNLFALAQVMAVRTNGPIQST